MNDRPIDYSSFYQFELLSRRIEFLIMTIDRKDNKVLWWQSDRLLSFLRRVVTLGYSTLLGNAKTMCKINARERERER